MSLFRWIKRALGLEKPHKCPTPTSVGITDVATAFASQWWIVRGSKMTGGEKTYATIEVSPGPYRGAADFVDRLSTSIMDAETVLRGLLSKQERQAPGEVRISEIHRHPDGVRLIGYLLFTPWSLR